MSSGFSKLVLAVASVVKEVRLCVEDQQAEAKRREKALRTELEVSNALRGVQVPQTIGIDMGITLEYVQAKVKEASINRDNLLKKANKVSPIDPNFPALVFRTMDECLKVLRVIKIQVDLLNMHIQAHTKPTLESEITDLIAELVPAKL